MFMIDLYIAYPHLLTNVLYLGLDVNSMVIPDVRGGCGNSESDVIPRVLYSPGYPSNYENRLNECLNVTPSHECSRITILDFNTEEDYDFLSVSSFIKLLTEWTI